MQPTAESHQQQKTPEFPVWKILEEQKKIRVGNHILKRKKRSEPLAAVWVIFRVHNLAISMQSFLLKTGSVNYIKKPPPLFLPSLACVRFDKYFHGRWFPTQLQVKLEECQCSSHKNCDISYTSLNCNLNSFHKSLVGILHSYQ